MDVRYTLFVGVFLAMSAGHAVAPRTASAQAPGMAPDSADAKTADPRVAEPAPGAPAPGAPAPGAPAPAPSPAAEAAARKKLTPASKPGAVVSEASFARLIDRPHTVAELELGVLALPTAPISSGQSGGDTPFGTIGRGDATMQTGLHVLYRWNREFAIGAGASFAPLPTTDPEYGGLRSLPRTHSRSYFFFGTEGRYIPFHYRFFEAWVGLSIGGVVVADRFTTEAGDRVPPILGTKEVTVRTEGFAFGVQFGSTYYLSENWIAGLNFRVYRWILPQTPRCSSIGDCATLSGTVEALELGLTIGYRLPL